MNGVVIRAGELVSGTPTDVEQKAKPGAVLPWVLTLIALFLPQLAQAGAREHLKKGQEAMAKGEFLEARKAFDLARQEAPNWAMAQLHWAIAETSLAPESPKARQALERAIELLPGNPRAHYHLGLVLMAQGNWGDAKGHFEKVLQKRKAFRDTHFHLGMTLRKLGDIRRALTHFEKFLEKNPKHSGALTQSAELYEKLGDLQASEDAWIALAKLQPQGAYPRYQLALFYERTGQRRKARAARKKAEAIDPRPKRQMRQLR